MPILEEFCKHLKPELNDYGKSHSNRVKSSFSCLKNNINNQSNINFFLCEYLLLIHQKRIMNDDRIKTIF